MAPSIYAAARAMYHALATATVDRVLDRDAGQRSSWRIGTLKNCSKVQVPKTKDSAKVFEYGR